MNNPDERMDSVLGGEIRDAGSFTSREIDAEMPSGYRENLRILEELEAKAPDDFLGRVMSRLPDSFGRRWLGRVWASWPGHGRWAVPAFAGAVGMLLIIFGISLFFGGGGRSCCRPLRGICPIGKNRGNGRNLLRLDARENCTERTRCRRLLGSFHKVASRTL